MIKNMSFMKSARGTLPLPAFPQAFSENLVTDFAVVENGDQPFPPHISIFSTTLWLFYLSLLKFLSSSPLGISLAPFSSAYFFLPLFSQNFFIPPL